MMAKKAPNKKTLGTTGRNSIVATDPTKANVRSNIFLCLPWSAAPDMDRINSVCISTLIEKVYIAKLAVFISEPSTYTTNFSASLTGALVDTSVELNGGSGTSKLDPHGLV